MPVTSVLEMCRQVAPGGSSLNHITSGSLEDPVPESGVEKAEEDI